jgi:manganese oxidase
MQLLLRSIALVSLIALPLRAQSLPPIRANDNRLPAGTLENGTLTLKLDIVRALWLPDRDTDPGIDMLAFAEADHQPGAPGPLIRVPIGTEIRTTVRNLIADSSILIVGLSGAGTFADSVRVQPGETRELRMRANKLGTTVYRGFYRMPPLPVPPLFRQRADALLGGAIVVDEPGHRVNDRVLVLQMLRDSEKLPEAHGTSGEILTINGKSWPFTERLTYQLGDTIQWRVVNASLGPHPMHLHGSYFDVLSRGFVGGDTLYLSTAIRKTVTERMAPLTTMLVRWSPYKAGNWAFHCHLTPHIAAHPPLAPAKAASEHDGHGMGGLVMGVTVNGSIAVDTRPRTNIRLVAEQYDSIPGELVPRYSYEFDDARKMSFPGPAIVVQRNEPLAITVVNHTEMPTSVHWHGLEIESYYDGVPRFGGNPGRSAPLIAPKDSFVVKMTPPRAGTFIYHTHANELREQRGGLVGPFVVLNDDEKWDAGHELILLLAQRRDSLLAFSVNGKARVTYELKAGETYRLRLINITMTQHGVTATLSKDNVLVGWKLIARDGADLPAWQAGHMPARLQPFTLGQTYDALFTPTDAGTYVLDFKSPTGHAVSATFDVRK